MTRQAELKRRIRARMARTGESYAAARTHVLAERRPEGEGLPPGALHITNGDATVPELRATGLADAVVPWRDALHDGPVPDVPDADLRRIRAEFLAAGIDVGVERVLADLEARDRLLEERRGDPFVLWFEADLYDQLQIVQILARLGALGVPPHRITLICVGEHLGIARFGGLGQLRAEQLARLPAIAATPLSGAAMAHAAGAWAALRAPEPGGLGPVARTPSAELRFLAEAFDRLSREYPSTRDGLSLTERRLLAAVAEGAPTAAAAFVRASAKEPRPFLGDDFAFDRLARLAAGPSPLVALEPAGPRVAGATRVALNGVDRWIGGVRLSAETGMWRWDDGTEAVVRAGA